MSVGNYTQSGEKRRLNGVIEKCGVQSGLSTPGMFLFGLPFASIGVWVTLVGLKIVPANPSSVHTPYFFLVAFGLVFVGGGLFLWSTAWRQFRSNRHRALALAHHVNEPALKDYDWDPRGFYTHCWATVAKSIAFAGFLALFLSMFNWWAWGAKGPLMVKAMVSLFDCVLVFVCWRVLLTFCRALRFGNSHIEFVHFPYRTSESIVVRWLTPPGISRANKGAFTLRCVKEWTETTGTGKNRTSVIVHEEQWSGTWSLDASEDFPPGKNMDWEFKPAPGLPATCLDGPETFFWEFEIKLSLPGPDFEETYLVPVY
ncbi:MAG TPA: hypothetical protein VG938_16875 [Verrucomicrobiae bacterium]|nr:hypothetical protein [Verrucomicrobiae bacterium]